MISQSRYLDFVIEVQNSNNTWFDITAYCEKCSINYGDLSGLGTMGFDGVSRTCNFTVRNDYENIFNPKLHYGVRKYHSETINGTGTDTYTLTYTPYEGSTRTKYESGTYYCVESVSGNQVTFYDNIPNGTDVKVQYTYLDTADEISWNDESSVFYPLLNPTNYVRVSAAAGAPTYYSETLTGDGTSRLTLTQSNVIDGSIRVKSVASGDWYNQQIAYDSTTGEAVFTELTPNGINFDVQYSYYSGSSTQMFYGIIRSSSPSLNKVECMAMDQSKLMQDAFILDGDIRSYTVTENLGTVTVTDNSIPYAHVGGIPLETLIQNLCDDMLGVGAVTLTTPVPPSYNVYVKEDMWEYKSLWDTIQDLVGNIGWYCGFKIVSGNIAFTLLEPPRTKTSADYALDYKTDIHVQNLTMTDLDIRNKIIVKYVDIDGDRQLVTSQDATSISNYGTRPVIVEDIYGINTSAIATILADNILLDLKDMLQKNSVTIPILPQLEIFDTISIADPHVNDGTEVFAIDSIQQNIDFNSKQFRTTLATSNKVRGMQQKARKIQSRQGGSKPTVSRKINSLFGLPAPYNFSVSSSGIEKVAQTPTATAVLSWDPPVGIKPDSYRVRVKLSSDADYSNSAVYDVKEPNTKIYLSIDTAYKAKVASVNTGNIVGDYTSEITISAIGDSVAPSAPANPAVVSIESGLRINFDRNTEDDFSYYNIYIRKGAEPTTGTYDIKKETKSTITIVNALDTDDSYYVRITAVDTSGNESSLSSSGVHAIPGRNGLESDYPEIRDKVCYIKTQTQFTNWMTSLDSSDPDPSYSDLPYEKVVLDNKGSDYTYSPTTSNHKYIRKPNFEIEFRNSRLKLTIDAGVSDMSYFLFLEVDSLVLTTDIEIEKNNATYYFYAFTISEATETIGNIILEKSRFQSTGSSDLVCALEILCDTFSSGSYHSNLVLEKTYFYDCFINLYSANASYNSTKRIINKCYFYNTAETISISGNIPHTGFGSHEFTDITNCTFYNGKIKLKKSGYINIEDNTFISTLDFSSKYYVYFDAAIGISDTSILAANVSNNIVKASGNTTGYNFVDSKGGTSICYYSQCNNNSAYSSAVSSWITFLNFNTKTSTTESGNVSN